MSRINVRLIFDGFMIIRYLRMPLWTWRYGVACCGTMALCRVVASGKLLEALAKLIGGLLSCQWSASSFLVAPAKRDPYPPPPLGGFRVAAFYTVSGSAGGCVRLLVSA